MPTFYNNVLYTLKKDKEIIIKLLKTLFTRGASAAGTFLFNVVLARTMGAEEYGLFVIANTIIVGIGLFCQFGSPQAILRFCSIMYKNRKFGQFLKLKRDVTFLSFSLSVLFAILLCINSNFISNLFFDGLSVNLLIYVFAAALPIYTFLGIQSAFFKALYRPEIAPFFEMGLIGILTAILVFILSYFDEMVTSVDSGLIFLMACFIVFILGMLILNRILKKETQNEKYNHERYYGFYSSISSYWISSVSSYLLKFSPILILGYYYSSQDVAYYSIANYSAFLINFVLWIISSVYAPYFANFYNENRFNELNKSLTRSTIYMLTIAVPIFAIIVCFPKAIMTIFDANYSGSYLPLIILAIAQLINVATGPVLFLMNMIGKERVLMKIILWTSALSIILGLLLIPNYSYTGAAISTAIGLVCQNLVAFYVAKKIITNR